jgi:hypothetical protein
MHLSLPLTRILTRMISMQYATLLRVHLIDSYVPHLSSHLSVRFMQPGPVSLWISPPLYFIVTVLIDFISYIITYVTSHVITALPLFHQVAVVSFCKRKYSG